MSPRREAREIAVQNRGNSRDLGNSDLSVCNLGSDGSRSPSKRNPRARWRGFTNDEGAGRRWSALLDVVVVLPARHSQLAHRRSMSLSNAKSVLAVVEDRELGLPTVSDIDANQL